MRAEHANAASAGSSAPIILMVESLAHLNYGHLANRFAELATALADAGCQVTVLTSQGWARQHEYPAPPFDLLEYRPLPKALNKVALALRPSPALKGRGEGQALESRLAGTVRGFRGLVSSSAALMAITNSDASALH